MFLIAMVGLGLVIPHAFAAMPYYDACGQNVSGYNETVQCIRELNQYYAMNRNATNYMDYTNQQTMKNIEKNQVLANENQTASLKMSYKNMAKEALTKDLQHQADYQAYGNAMTKILLEQTKYQMDVTRINIGQTYGVSMQNSSPDQVSSTLCPAWHVCKLASVPTALKVASKIGNSTSFTPKPEFKKAPSGYMSSENAIKNWQDLEAWMISKNMTK